MAARGRNALAALGLLLGAALGPAAAQDASELVVRLNRLEGQVRQMSGQIEQLQFENRQQKDQLRKFQEDVEFRFQERSGGASRPSASQPPSAQAPAARPQRRSDAFDPESEPGAAGAPRQLGSTASAAPPPVSSELPRRRGGEDTAFSEGAPLDLGGAARDTLNPGFAGAGRVAAAPSGSDPTKAEYDAAYALHRDRQYDQSEAAFRRFLGAHGRDRLAPDATYWLGDSYAQRGKHREAAEQFLKLSTEYSRSAKAPDGLLKLGTSLAALGAKDQACATFAEVERKYPNASASVKQGVDREQKRARCPA